MNDNGVGEGEELFQPNPTKASLPFFLTLYSYAEYSNTEFSESLLSQKFGMLVQVAIAVGLLKPLFPVRSQL